MSTTRIETEIEGGKYVVADGFDDNQDDDIPSGSGRWELISPGKAAEFLACASKQRRIIPSVVEHYARQMREGLWEKNPELVILNKTGEMLEGQHRCQAIIKADRSVWMFVFRGADDKIFPFLNTGRIRTGRDIVSVRYKDAHSTSTAAAATLLWKYERSKFKTVAVSWKPSPNEVSETVDAHKALAILSTNGPKEVSRLLGPGPSIFCRFILAQKDALASELFFDAVANGTTERGTGPRELRERMMQLGRNKPGPIERIALTFKAWNIDRSGRRVKILSWRKSEVFPELE